MKPAILSLALAFGLGSIIPGFAQDPLPSWNDTAAKQSIIVFVQKVTKQGGPDFVPPAERIAVFDNDGTLWCENPMPFQAAFAISEIMRQLPEHPECVYQPMLELLAWLRANEFQTWIVSGGGIDFMRW